MTMTPQYVPVVGVSISKKKLTYLLQTEQTLAIQYQIRSKLEHELRMILPRLHGISSLLQESTAATIQSIHELRELFSLTSGISEFALGESGTMLASKKVRQYCIYLLTILIF